MGKCEITAHGVLARLNSIPIALSTRAFTIVPCAPAPDLLAADGDQETQRGAIGSPYTWPAIAGKALCKSAKCDEIKDVVGNVRWPDWPVLSVASVDGLSCSERSNSEGLDEEP